MNRVPWLRAGGAATVSVVVSVVVSAAVALPPQSASAASGGAADQIVVVREVGAPGTGSETVRREVRATSGKVPYDHLSKIDGMAAPRRGPIVSPLLRTVMQGKNGGNVTVMVSVEDAVPIPEFPAAVTGESPALAASRQAQAQSLADRLEAQRAPANLHWRDKVTATGGRVLKEFWLAQGFIAELPVAAVDTLAAQPGVLSVDSAETVMPFPDTDPGNDLSVARSLMGTDLYRSSGGPSNTIALIDSGVNPHVLLPPGGVTVIDMVDRNPKITADICDHGTRSTTAMVGTNALGDGVRGITDMRVRAYHTGKIGPLPNGTIGCGNDPIASVVAFLQAVLDGMKVIVAEIQLIESPDSLLNQLADNAFRSGAVVLGAAGNFGGGADSVRAPANARNVLGIGAVNVKTFVPPFPQGHGPTVDGRVKPDLVTPSSYEAGWGSSSTATQPFTGTSGATAAAGGTAAALRAFLKGANSTIDPGLVYAALIAGGSHPWPFDNGEGAGKLQLPSGATAMFAVTVTPGGFVDVPIDLPASPCRFSAALWWPAPADGPSNADNDVDLDVFNPAAQLVANSVSGPSVFELTRLNTATAGGRWTIRARSFSMVSAQVVYGAVSLCR